MQLQSLLAVITTEAGLDTGYDSPTMSSGQLQTVSATNFLSCTAK